MVMDTGAWIVLGLLVGVTARIVYPGRSPVGCLMTIPAGVGGALLGTYLGTLLGWGTVRGFDPRSLGLALLGTLVVLVAWRLIFGRRS